MRAIASALGRLLIGAAVIVFALGLVLCAIGAYLVAVPYAKMSRTESRLLAFVRAAQTGAALAVVLRRSAGDEAELEPDEPAAN